MLVLLSVTISQHLGATARFCTGPARHLFCNARPSTVYHAGCRSAVSSARILLVCMSPTEFKAVASESLAPKT